MQLENTIPQPLFKTSSPTFVGMSLSGLTPSRLVATDAASELVSVSNLASWIAGTSNRVTVTDDADGTITLSGPQDIHTGASPTFAGLNLDDTANDYVELGFNTSADANCLWRFEHREGELFFAANTHWEFVYKLDLGGGLTGDLCIFGEQESKINTNLTLTETLKVDYIDEYNSGHTVAFNDGITIESLSGLLKASTGVVSAITVGTTAQYLRGDESYQTLNQAAVAGLTTADSPTFAGLTLTGLISIPATSATIGQIQQNSIRVFHTYATDNLFVGAYSGNFTTSGVGQNVGVGSYTLDALTTGSMNMAVGGYAGTSITEGIGNIMIGRSAGAAITTGDANMLFGRNAGYAIISGSDNVGIGAYALNTTTGNYNVGIGTFAGYTTTGSSNVFIGNLAGAYCTLSNRLVIDNQNRTNEATEITNALIYGVFAAAPANQTLRINALLGIGKTPTVPVDVVGAIANTTSITAGTGFGCNGSAAQTAYASGGAAATTAGDFGFGSDAQRAALTTLVANIRLALVANGIMS